MSAWPIDLWNEWAIPITVLFSFTLQVVLLVFAGIRRGEASPVSSALLWLAYQLSDSTAKYALGLFSIVSTETRDHELIAFWVPFLLLHLGGPDNITALSLEDNQLWKRHLLTIFVQVLTAAYVLYRLVSSSGSLVLMVATMLIFAVGVVKYAERIWALKCGNLDDIRSSINNSQVEDDSNSKINPEGIRGMYEDQELLEIAHSQFHFCKLKLVDSSVTMKCPRLQYDELGWAKMWKLMAMELSLLYDILYTKASVTHTRTGYMVRFAAPPAIVAALALFQLHLMMTSGGTEGHKHRRVDVAITYALLAGSFFMEVTVLLAAIGSTWTLAFLSGLPERNSIRHPLVCSGRWHQLRRLLLPLSRLDIRRRSWLGTIGQYNLFHLCIRDSDGHLVRRLARMLGLEEWWRKFHYSGSIVVPDNLKELLFEKYKLHMSEKNVNGLGLLRRNFGDLALDKHEAQYIRRSVGGNELQEDIVMWHIATDIYLAKRVVVRDGDHTTVGHIEVLSNYMMFLLVNHTDLLPGLVLHRVYDISRANLVTIWGNRDPDHEKTRVLAGAGSVWEKLFRLHDEPVLSSSMTMVSQKNQLAKILIDKLIIKIKSDEEKKRKRAAENNDTSSSMSKLNKPSDVDDPFYDSLFRVEYGARIAHKLLNRDNEKKALRSSTSLDVILDVWLDFLFYVANKCSRESYAKKLSSGVELTAILWLMGAHFQPCRPTINPEDDTITIEEEEVS